MKAIDFGLNALHTSRIWLFNHKFVMSSPELEMRSCTGHGVNRSPGKVGSGHLGVKTY